MGSNIPFILLLTFLLAIVAGVYGGCIDDKIVTLQQDASYFATSPQKFGEVCIYSFIDFSLLRLIKVFPGFMEGMVVLHSY